jgi:hypothetical protein
MPGSEHHRKRRGNECQPGQRRAHLQFQDQQQQEQQRETHLGHPDDDEVLHDIGERHRHRRLIDQDDRISQGHRPHDDVRVSLAVCCSQDHAPGGRPG